MLEVGGVDVDGEEEEDVEMPAMWWCRVVVVEAVVAAVHVQAAQGRAVSRSMSAFGGG